MPYPQRVHKTNRHGSLLSKQQHDDAQLLRDSKRTKCKYNSMTGLLERTSCPMKRSTSSVVSTESHTDQTPSKVIKLNRNNSVTIDSGSSVESSKSSPSVKQQISWP